MTFSDNKVRLVVHKNEGCGASRCRFDVFFALLKFDISRYRVLHEFSGPFDGFFIFILHTRLRVGESLIKKLVHNNVLAYDECTYDQDDNLCTYVVHVKFYELYYTRAMSYRRRKNIAKWLFVRKLRNHARYAYSIVQCTLYNTRVKRG